MEGRLGITWGLSSIHGWGVFGLNLIRVLANKVASSGPRPLIVGDAPLDLIDPADHPLLTDLIAERDRLIEGSKDIALVGLEDTLLIHSSGNGLSYGPESARYRGSRNIGFTFFEDTDIDEKAIDAAKTLNGMRTGSNWNRDYLLSRGVPNVETVHQGVDVDRFRPRLKTGRFEGRFVVFSGGKLEFRKGQDIALAAFKAFQARHPDALLVSIWHNPWPESMASLSASSHVSSLPEVGGDTSRNLMRWTEREGLPAGAHMDLGMVGNAQLPSILSEVDVALFPNRSEGGTNLVAMECMASGIPCILSMNTGHFDIVTPENCLPLESQAAVHDPEGHRQSWGESNVDEVLTMMERIYAEREQKALRENAVRDMKAMSWPNQIEKLVASFET